MSIRLIIKLFVDVDKFKLYIGKLRKDMNVVLSEGLLNGYLRIILCILE